MKELHKVLPHVRVLAYGGHDDPDTIVAYAEAGVVGCFPCQGSVAELAAAIVGSRHDEVQCSARAAAALFKRVAALAGAAQVTDQEAPLTHRETEIVTLLASGLSNKEIAQQLHVEVATVKNHVHNILDKLRVPSRHHVARRMKMSLWPGLDKRVG